MSKSSPESYRELFRSTSLLGGAAGVNAFLGIVRMKFAAVLIGPAGVGLVATYQVIQVMMTRAAGLGIHQSAVREIAAAIGAGDDDALGRTVLVLRRVSWVTGILGMFAMLALATPLSQFTFDTAEFAFDIALLGPLVLFASIQGGQAAVLQGMRRVADLARVNVISASIGTVGAVALYSTLGMRGIVPSLLLLSVSKLAVTWYFRRRLTLASVNLSWKDSLGCVHTLLRLGLVFLWNGLLLSLVSYLTRAWISQDYDIAAVGIYSAAFALSGFFVEFILRAMGADFYPKLTEMASNHGAMRRLVNQQTEIGLLLAMPSLMAILTFSPWIIQLFYSSEFLPAVDLLQWFVLGCLARVVSWPLRFVMLALAKNKWLFATETALNCAHLTAVWLCLGAYGVEGAAIAFLAAYVFYCVLTYSIARALIEFSWSRDVMLLLYLALPAVMALFFATKLLPLLLATMIGVAATCIASVLCLRALFARLGAESKITKIGSRIPGFRKLFSW